MDYEKAAFGAPGDNDNRNQVDGNGRLPADVVGVTAAAEHTEAGLRSRLGTRFHLLAVRAGVLALWRYSGFPGCNCAV